MGGLLLHLLGAVIALYSGAGFNLAALLWGQIAVTASQLMTHYANDYFDLDADRTNLTPTRWSGGSRVLTGAQIAPRVALQAALTLASIALIADLVLSLHDSSRSWDAAPAADHAAIGLVLQRAADPPAFARPGRTHDRSDRATAHAANRFLLASRALARLPFLAAAPLCCFQFAMLLAIEFPDVAGDRRVGKRTLVVRWGAPTAAASTDRAAAGIRSLPLLVLAGLPPLAAER